MRTLLFSIAIFAALACSAQLLDTSQAHQYKPLQSYLLQEETLLFFEEDSTFIDTSTFGFEAFYPAWKEDLPVLDLAYEGSPYMRLDEVRGPSTQLELGSRSLDIHFYDTEIRRIHTDRPFTRLNYSQGQNELIFIEAKHGQQISDRLTLGVDYRRLKNHNFYYSNIIGGDNIRFANLFNTKIYTGYYNRDRSYELLAAYIWNKNSNIETAGLVNTDDFESLVSRNKLNNNPVHLADARNSLAGHDLKLVQYFRLKPKGLDSSKLGLQDYRRQFVWTLQFSSRKLEFSDHSPDSAYYGLKANELFDSTHHNRLHNDISYVIKRADYALQVGGMIDRDWVYQDSMTRGYSSLKPYVRFQKEGRLHVHGLAQSSLGGYNAGDLLLDFGIASATADAAVGYQKVHPLYLDQQRFAPMAFWENTFGSIKTLTLKANYKRKWNHLLLRTQLKLKHINKAVYYGKGGLPQQYEGAMQFFHVGVTLQRSNERFGFQIHSAYQYSSNDSILARPEFLTKASVYTTLYLFQRNLKTQWGISSYWYSSFNAPVYDPVSRNWLISTTPFKAYPPIQVFVNAKVKSFHMGIQLLNAQQGLMGEAYYSSPYYPIMPRTMRLNIRWDLPN